MSIQKKDCIVHEKNFDEKLLKHLSMKDNLMRDGIDHFNRLFISVPYGQKLVLPEDLKRKLDILGRICMTLNSDKYLDWRTKNGISMVIIAYQKGYTNITNHWDPWYPVAISSDFDITKTSFNNEDSKLYEIYSIDDVNEFLRISLPSKQERVILRHVDSYKSVSTRSDTTTHSTSSNDTVIKSSNKNSSNTTQANNLLKSIISASAEDLARLNLAMFELSKENLITLKIKLEQITEGVIKAL